jgi:hypothetical protein
MMSTFDEDALADVLVLAALERAERHAGGDTSGVPVLQVLAHLEIASRSRRARDVRARVDALEGAGQLERARHHGVQVWALTSAGRRRLARARRASRLPELPESPQHRAWREARAAAAAGIDGLREQLRAALAEAVGLLDAEGVASDAWFERGEQLRRLSRQLASATYCVREWSEPDDAAADVDDYGGPGDEQLDPNRRAHLRFLRTGRRSTRL